jgi:heat-inducible transcriptional repressor
MTGTFSVTDREEELLLALVRRHIRDGEPVGSKTLQSDTGLPVSSATIRNIVADLEERGYVSSPHTSAGRVPTAKAYRLYIDRMISVQPLEEEIARMRSELDPDKPVKELIESASTLLSSITHHAGLVTMQRAGDVILRQVEFLPLSGQRVLVILVLDEKEVQNRIVHLDRAYDEAELRRAANYINAELAGHSLDEIRELLHQQLQQTRRRIDAMLQSAIDLARLALAEPEAGGGECVVAGQSNLLEGASGDRMARLRELFEVFQHKTDLLHLVERCHQADGVQIFVGEEAGYEPLVDFSLIAAPYHSSERTIGVLGVIGPTRMAYDRVIPIVDVTARMLGAALRG